MHKKKWVDDRRFHGTRIASDNRPRDVKGWKEQIEIRDLMKRRHGRRINFADARRDRRVISEAITRIKDVQEG